ncbi:hypothetical protein EI42_01682 [Thermosporothrix hazakensis]|uniref:Uncharacterized protein n=1 Tax=Thermosporothrix hazakensis TaxID=644383 RepID=A0A326U995_THEHA|nr:hypothetical protein [Thermosporothrix hazakensis]PZW32590.1 hypothetical protein EI42_01682 [Thermosporothrix hazakensis]
MRPPVFRAPTPMKAPMPAPKVATPRPHVGSTQKPAAKPDDLKQMSSSIINKNPFTLKPNAPEPSPAPKAKPSLPPSKHDPKAEAKPDEKHDPKSTTKPDDLKQMSSSIINKNPFTLKPNAPEPSPAPKAKPSLASRMKEAVSALPEHDKLGALLRADNPAALARERSSARTPRQPSLPKPEPKQPEQLHSTYGKVTINGSGNAVGSHNIVNNGTIIQQPGGGKVRNTSHSPLWIAYHTLHSLGENIVNIKKEEAMGAIRTAETAAH